MLKTLPFSLTFKVISMLFYFSDSSMEYTDSSGVDLQQFIIQTLHKNQKDRMMLLKIEHELVSLVKDSK